jgi:hypothetical protein
MLNIFMPNAFLLAAQKMSPDALALREMYSTLAKKNLCPHHLGTARYAPKDLKMEEARRGDEAGWDARPAGGLGPLYKELGHGQKTEGGRWFSEIQSTTDGTSRLED